MNTRTTIFAQIENERDYQDKRWGTAFDDSHNPADWWTFVTFYYTRALGPWRINKENPDYFEADRLRAGLIKIAAIVVAWIEALDRRAA
jgi:hypothetical protein